jgi:hypothetical protein
VQASSYLTVGTPDANGAGANSVGSILLKVKTTSPEDVLINAGITDVRCMPATSASVCTSANAGDGPDYSGEVQGSTTIRVSDHYNGPGLNEAATVLDVPLSVTGTCVNTASTTVGATCTVATTANTVVPGAIKDTQRAVVETSQVQINDGGADGVVSTADNTLFLDQGIFIP